MKRILVELINRSKQKTFLFIGTIFKTMHEISKRNNTVFTEKDVLKSVGMESYAFY